MANREKKIKFGGQRNDFHNFVSNLWDDVSDQFKGDVRFFPNKSGAGAKGFKKFLRGARDRFVDEIEGKQKLIREALYGKNPRGNYIKNKYVFSPNDLDVLERAKEIQYRKECEYFTKDVSDRFVTEINDYIAEFGQAESSLKTKKPDGYGYFLDSAECLREMKNAEIATRKKIMSGVYKGHKSKHSNTVFYVMEDIDPETRGGMTGIFELRDLAQIELDRIFLQKQKDDFW